LPILYCTAEPRGRNDSVVHLCLTVTLLACHSVPETKWNSSSHTLPNANSRTKSYLH
ncbi:hypothetical protein BAE44_0005343, partial [Dichanthelium oligosanthes]